MLAAPGLASPPEAARPFADGARASARAADEARGGTVATAGVEDRDLVRTARVVTAVARVEAALATRPGEERAAGERGRPQAAAAEAGSAAPGEDEAARGPDDLTKEEEAQVRELKQRDAEVKQHEQAHANVGGPYAGSPSYQYQRGPDGRNYAVAGEVPIDASPEREPEQTIRKMEIVIRAALAPAEPSPQDRQVAAQAAQQRAEAQADLQKERLAEQRGDTQESSAGPPAAGRDEPAVDRGGAGPAGERAAQAVREAIAAYAALQAGLAGPRGRIA